MNNERCVFPMDNGNFMFLMKFDRSFGAKVLYNGLYQKHKYKTFNKI
jgi:hypothetical protein